MPPCAQAELKQIGRKTVRNGFLEVPERITYTVDKHEEIQRFNILLLFGLSFYWLWLIAGILSTLVWYETTAENKADTWLVTLAANTVILALAYPLVRRLGPLVRRPLLVIASASVTAAGIALVSIAYNIGDYGHLLFFGCVLTGCGAGPLGMCWRERSEQLTTKRTQRQLISLSLVASIMLYLLTLSLPFIVALIICAAAPILSALLFLFTGDSSALRGVVRTRGPSASTAAQKRSPSASTAAQKTTLAAKSSSSKRRHLAQLLACCFMLSIAQGVFKAGTLSVDTRLTWTLIVSSVDIAIMGVVALEILGMRYLPKRVLARLFLPFVVIACLSLPFLIYHHPLITHFFIFAGSFLLLVYLYSEIDAADSGPRLPTQLFAAGIIASNLGCILGLLLGKLMHGELFMGVVGVVYALGCLVVCVRYEADLLPSRDERFQVAAAGDGQDRISAAGDERDRIAATGDGQDRRDQNSPELPLTPHSAESLPTMTDSISFQCRNVALHYALTTREEEILCYMVRGKSAKSIADATFTSYNTVKTHISHIYQKVGAHTREDLAQLVESTTATSPHRQ
jgi:DNA-binding CsgD family transcriptional regulator